MGCFSWKESDIKKAIKIMNTSRPVYLLQPDGNHIKECEYDGYGHFGGIDAYEWLAKVNKPELYSDNTEQNRSLGICLESIYMDRKSGILRDIDDHTLHSFHHHTLLDEIQPFKGTYMDEYKNGLTYSEAIEKSILVDHNPFGEVKYPLKFSANPNAKYDELPYAQHDPKQGC